jgi:hypothetical protein
MQVGALLAQAAKRLSGGRASLKTSHDIIMACFDLVLRRVLVSWLSATRQLCFFFGCGNCPRLRFCEGSNRDTAIRL